MADTAQLAPPGTIITVRDLINRLRESNPNLPIRLVNNKDPGLESMEIKEVFFFEALDTQDGNKESHMVISY